MSVRKSNLFHKKKKEKEEEKENERIHEAQMKRHDLLLV